MQRADNDLDLLQAEATDEAERSLRSSEPLEPFAIALTADLTILRHEVAPDTVEGSETPEEILAYAARAGIGGSPRAVALVRDVLVHCARRSLGGEEAM